MRVFSLLPQTDGPYWEIFHVFYKYGNKSITDVNNAIYTTFPEPSFLSRGNCIAGHFKATTSPKVLNAISFHPYLKQSRIYVMDLSQYLVSTVPSKRMSRALSVSQA